MKVSSLFKSLTPGILLATWGGGQCWHKNSQYRKHQARKAFPGRVGSNHEPSGYVEATLAVQNLT